MSQTYEERKTQLLNSIIMSPEGTPTKALTFKPNTLTPVEVHNAQGRKRRSGQPRVKWIDATLENLWQVIKNTNPELRYTALNLDMNTHIEQLKIAAGHNLHEITPGYITCT